jgi:uncharacterized protein (TIGR03083 family)
MNDTVIDVNQIAPIDHAGWMALSKIEYGRLSELFASLGAEDWDQQTECPVWTVKDMAGHLLGAAEANASMLENGRQMMRGLSAAQKSGGVLADGLSEVQVRKHAGDSAADVAAAYASTWPKAVKGRARTPGFLRKGFKLTVEVPGIKEKWSLGYLVDTIYTRDAWMHRLDICRATGRPFERTADHDGVIVADVVAEWARRHGQPFELSLDGPDGGVFVSGAGGSPGGGEQLTLDAVEFCRIVSGREPGEGLLEQLVAF